MSTETPPNARQWLYANFVLDSRDFEWRDNEGCVVPEFEICERYARAVLAAAERALRERAAKLNKTDYSREECVAIGLTEAADLLAGMRGT